MAATGWQAHTVRGTFAGAIKKTPGLKLTSAKAKGGDRIYRVQARPVLGMSALGTSGSRLILTA